MVTRQKNQRGDVTTMMFYDMSQQYHAERIRSATEQRRADDELGMTAARIARTWRWLTQPTRPAGRGRAPGGGDALRARYAGR
jgi:hypothetical protein